MTTTGWWVLAIFLTAVGYDIWAEAYKGTYWTISYALKTDYVKYRAIGFFAGGLISHLFLSKSNGLHDVWPVAAGLIIGYIFFNQG